MTIPCNCLKWDKYEVTHYFPLFLVEKKERRRNYEYGVQMAFFNTRPGVYTTFFTFNKQSIHVQNFKNIFPNSPALPHSEFLFIYQYHTIFLSHKLIIQEFQMQKIVCRNKYNHQISSVLIRQLINFAQDNLKNNLSFRHQIALRGHKL